MVCYGLCIHCIPAVFDTKPSPSSVVCGQFACLVSFLSTEANGFPFTQCDSFNINNIFIVFTIYTQSEIDFCFPFRMSSLIVTTSLPTVCAFICILIYPRIYTWENLFFFRKSKKKNIMKLFGAENYHYVIHFALAYVHRYRDGMARKKQKKWSRKHQLMEYGNGMFWFIWDFRMRRPITTFQWLSLSLMHIYVWYTHTKSEAHAPPSMGTQ